MLHSNYSNSSSTFPYGKYRGRPTPLPPTQGKIVKSRKPTTKTKSRSPEGAPRRPKIAPGATQDAPRSRQDAPRRPQDRPKRTQDAPRSPQDAPKSVPRGPKITSRDEKFEFAKTIEKRKEKQWFWLPHPPNLAPKTAQDLHKTAQDRPKSHTDQSKMASLAAQGDSGPHNLHVLSIRRSFTHTRRCRPSKVNGLQKRARQRAWPSGPADRV